MKHTFNTTLDSKEKVQLTVDFITDHLSTDELTKWAIKGITIAFQNGGLKKMLAKDAIEKYNGKSVTVGVEEKKLTAAEARMELARLQMIMKEKGIEA